MKWNHELRKPLKSRWKAADFSLRLPPNCWETRCTRGSRGPTFDILAPVTAPTGTSRPHPWPPRKYGLDGEGTLNDSIEATISVVIVVLRLRRPPWQDFHSAMAIEFWRSDQDHNTMNLNQLYIRFNHIQLPNYLDDSWWINNTVTNFTPLSRQKAKPIKLKGTVSKVGKRKPAWSE